MNFQLKAPTVIGVLLFCVVTGVGVTGSAYYKSLSLKDEETYFNQVFVNTKSSKKSFAEKVMNNDVNNAKLNERIEKRQERERLRNQQNGS